MKKTSGQDKKQKDNKKEKQNEKEQPDKKDRKIIVSKQDQVRSTEKKQEPEKSQLKLEIEHESNWKFYEEKNELNDLIGADYKALLEDSYEYSKYKMPEKKPDTNESPVTSNVLMLDLNKLNNAIRCESFHTNFMSNLNQSDYFNEEVIKLFDTKANEAREQMSKLNLLEQNIQIAETSEKTTETEIIKPQENKEKEEKKTEKQAETLPTSTQNQTIEDWLDDLIIE